MKLERVRTGDKLAAAYGIGLLLAMTLLDWFAPSGVGESAWEAFTATDLLLGLCAVGGILVAVVTAARPTPAWPLAVSVVTMVLCAVALPILLYRIANEPGPDDVTHVGAGAWIGFFVMGGLTLSAFWALRDERTPGLEPAPEPQTMPAPAPGQAEPAT